MMTETDFLIVGNKLVYHTEDEDMVKISIYDDPMNKVEGSIDVKTFRSHNDEQTLTINAVPPSTYLAI